ncbi:MAG: hypothetical protein A3G39_10885 [Deltaproteobacteria bacterium RIFCSPLOWO2_12_FULL_43_16]|nr:MAG: hypothetical protein A2Z89_07435 [Deltaproteobacteria bacterium GWA2_43_19]OGQ61145.1 MAG: hypothetical protein A3G39_10885 [Deltaproteobacteria bacterium RIFCSPLOWO2_12_FULL_43_16]HBR17094.1 hypothetical protein [Deltaproteobacteria bacterium]
MFARKEKRILVVDDEAAIRMLLSELLSEAGYSVNEAENGMNAWELLKKTDKYDLFILDVNMPQMDGITLCRFIMRDFPDMKGRFLFLTANITEDVFFFLKENDCKYIAKPFKMVDLLGQISVMLAQKEPSVVSAGAGKMQGQDRRVEERFLWLGDCRIFKDKIYDATPLSAKIQDISASGITVRYTGKPLAAGNSVTIHIIGLNLRTDAHIVWSKTMNEIETTAGLQFMEPISIPSAISGSRGINP